MGIPSLQRDAERQRDNLSRPRLAEEALLDVA
jgi:hypothetical protein